MKELKRLLPYLKKHRRKIYLGLLFITIANISAAAAPRVVGHIVDMISTGGFTESRVLWNIALFIGLTALSGLFMFLTRRRIIVASRLIEYDLRNDFLLSLESRPMSFYHKNPTGTLMAYATNDITAAREFLGPALMFSANAVTMFIFALAFMLSIDVRVTLLALLPLPVIAVATYVLGGKVHKAFKNVQAQYADLTAQAQESFSGIRIVKAYVREKYENEKFSEISKDYYKKNLRLTKYQSIMIPVIMTLVGMSLIIVLGYGGTMAIEGSITLGDITQFIIYLGLLIWPVASIGWITNLVQRASASAARLGEVLDYSGPTESFEKSDNNDRIKGNIKFRNVYLKYEGASETALKDIDMEIPAGTSLGIIGKVGCGKSSLVNLLPRLFVPTGGKILLDGKNLQDYSLQEIRKSIGFVPQDLFLFSATIAENISFGRPDADIEEIKHVAELACLHKEIENFPDRYETLLGERGISLSGGQKQRLALARALIRKPKILILDDALSAVDTHTEIEILGNIRDFSKDISFLIISHRISTVSNSDRIIVLDKGSIAETGSHDELLAKKGLYAEIYEQQMLQDEIERL